MSKKSYCDSDEIVQNIGCETGHKLRQKWANASQECSLVVPGLIQDHSELNEIKKS